MIQLLVRNSNKACKTVRDYLLSNHVQFVERNILKQPLTAAEIRELIQKQDDVLDIVSKHPASYQPFVSLLEQEETTMSQIYDFLQKHQELIRVPICYDEYRMAVGMGDELATFIPRSVRKEALNLMLMQLHREDVLKMKEEEVYEVHRTRFKICKRKVRASYWCTRREAACV